MFCFLYGIKYYHIIKKLIRFLQKSGARSARRNKQRGEVMFEIYLPSHRVN